MICFKIISGKIGIGESPRHVFIIAEITYGVQGDSLLSPTFPYTQIFHNEKKTKQKVLQGLAHEKYIGSTEGRA